MVDIKIRLVSLLGLLTVVVIVSLVLDYFHLLRRPYRLGMGIAILCIVLGFFLTISAVLPNNQVFGPVFTEVDTAQKVVALTFDDGPYPPYTGQILDVLKECNVAATFFVVGQNVEKHPELVKRIAREGHQLGNHTFHHVDLLKLEREKIDEEIDRTNRAVEKATGQVLKIARPPHGFRDAIVMEAMTERGLKVVEWSVMSRDWTNPGTDIIASRTMAKVKNGSVILLHDGDGVRQKASRAQTVEATRKIIKELKAKGYKFVTIDALFKKSSD